MSRFDCCDDEGDNWNLDAGRWEWNLGRAIRGRRGQRTLAILEEALLAMPVRELIESDLATPAGDVCALGAAVAHRKALAEGIPFLDAARALASEDPSWEGYEQAAEDFPGHYSKGDWVCVRYPSWGFVAGTDHWVSMSDPGGLRGSFPSRVAVGYYDVRRGDEEGPTRTCDAATDALDAASTLVWHIGFLNDERWGNRTPAERWERMLAWVREHRANPEAAA